MSGAASIQAVVFMFGVIGIMGTWDGLVRHHIRWSYDVMDTFIFLRGIPAILVGLISLPLFLFVLLLEVNEIQAILAACRSSFCIVQYSIFSLFTVWQSILIVLLFSFLFLYWLWGAFDLHGPYRRQMLAPGVWYKEKEVVALVGKQLQTYHLPQISDETILRTARTLIINMKTYMSCLTPKQLENGRLDPYAIADAYRDLNGYRMRNMDREMKEAQRRMVTTILRYYLDLHERAVEKWPWRKKLLGF